MQVTCAIQPTPGAVPMAAAFAPELAGPGDFAAALLEVVFDAAQPEPGQALTPGVEAHPLPTLQPPPQEAPAPTDEVIASPRTPHADRTADDESHGDKRADGDGATDPCADRRAPNAPAAVMMAGAALPPVEALLAAMRPAPQPASPTPRERLEPQAQTAPGVARTAAGSAAAAPDRPGALRVVPEPAQTIALAQPAWPAGQQAVATAGALPQAAAWPGTPEPPTAPDRAFPTPPEGADRSLPAGQRPRPDTAAGGWAQGPGAPRGVPTEATSAAVTARLVAPIPADQSWRGGGPQAGAPRPASAQQVQATPDAPGPDGAVLLREQPQPAEGLPTAIPGAAALRAAVPMQAPALTPPLAMRTAPRGDAVPIPAAPPVMQGSAEVTDTVAALHEAIPAAVPPTRKDTARPADTGSAAHTQAPVAPPGAAQAEPSDAVWPPAARERLRPQGATPAGPFASNSAVAGSLVPGLSVTARDSHGALSVSPRAYHESGAFASHRTLLASSSARGGGAPTQGPQPSAPIAGARVAAMQAPQGTPHSSVLGQEQAALEGTAMPAPVAVQQRPTTTDVPAQTAPAPAVRAPMLATALHAPVPVTAEGPSMASRAAARAGTWGPGPAAGAFIPNLVAVMPDAGREPVRSALEPPEWAPSPPAAPIAVQDASADGLDSAAVTDPGTEPAAPVPAATGRLPEPAPTVVLGQRPGAQMSESPAFREAGALEPVRERNPRQGIGIQSAADSRESTDPVADAAPEAPPTALHLPLATAAEAPAIPEPAHLRSQVLERVGDLMHRPEVRGEGRLELRVDWADLGVRGVSVEWEGDGARVDVHCHTRTVAAALAPTESQLRERLASVGVELLELRTSCDTGGQRQPEGADPQAWVPPRRWQGYGSGPSISWPSVGRPARPRGTGIDILA